MQFDGIDTAEEIFSLLRAVQDDLGRTCLEQARNVVVEWEDLEEQNENAIREAVDFFRDTFLPFARVYGGEHGRMAMTTEEIISRLTGDDDTPEDDD